VPDQAQLPQQRQACFQMADGVPRLTKRQVTVGDLEQAQRMGAACSLSLEGLRGLLVSLDGRLVAAEAAQAVAHQVKEIGPVLPLPAGSSLPQGP
jgi:hypothetical protein